MKKIIEQRNKWEQQMRETNQTAKERNLPGLKMEKVYEKGDVAVYKRTVTRKDPDSLFIEFTSSVHWSSAVEITFASRFTKDPEWDISYGSGGTVGAEPEQIAEAMGVIFDQAHALMTD